MELTVLLVDDEAVFREYVREMAFWKKGNFVLKAEARNAQEALAILEKMEMDIVILDVSMPGKNGAWLSAVLAATYPAIAMVAVSSFDSYDYVREILKNGAHDYILKGRLTEELLLNTLENIGIRMTSQTPWERKSRLRRQVQSWLFHGEVNPFTSDNSRKLVTVARLDGNERMDTADEIAISDGICKLMEDAAADRQDILAFYHAPHHFVLFARFYDAVSEEEMRRQQEVSLSVMRESIRKIYGLKIEYKNCPVFYNDNALRTFLLHKMDAEKEAQTERKPQLALTIGEQKKLLSAIECNQPEEAEAIIRTVFGQIPQGREGEGRRMIVTKELLDMIERISQEYQIELNFLPRDFMLYQYTRHKDKEALTSVIAGLYLNVLREIAGKDVLDKQYSELVTAAVSYLKKHYASPIGLSTVSDAIGVNSSYLSRIFHEETKKTVTEYLNGTRIEAAKHYLEDSGLPLKEIVSRCGFNHYGYFIKTFKEYTGKTPGEYSREFK